jgi:hypothetical protein
VGPRDAKRSDVYLAEEVAFDGTVLADRPGGAALRGAVEGVLASAWWRSNVGDPSAVRRVTVRSASDSHWAASTGTLALDPGESWFVVTHELAHVAAGVGHEVHGPAWRGWDEALVSAVFGADLAALLRASFDRFALPVAVPSLAVPATPLHPIVPPQPVRGGWRPG